MGIGGSIYFSKNIIISHKNVQKNELLNLPGIEYLEKNI